jgi:hypothetical protein
MLSISDNALFQRSLAALPLVIYPAGETVLTAALNEDAVEVVTEGAGGANLVYAGYPYDPFAPHAPKN